MQDAMYSITGIVAILVLCGFLLFMRSKLSAGLNKAQIESMGDIKGLENSFKPLIRDLNDTASAATHNMELKISELQGVIREANEVLKRFEEISAMKQVESVMPAPPNLEQIPATPTYDIKGKVNLAEPGVTSQTSENENPQTFEEILKISQETVPLTSNDLSDKKDTIPEQNPVVELFESGMPEVDIARQLGIGIGEVRLTLQLHKRGSIS